MYTIDTNEIKVYPLPKKQSRGRPSKYPFDKLLVNESFFVPETDAKKSAIASSVSVFCKRHEDFGSIKFIIGSVEEDHGDFDEGGNVIMTKGTRIWRLS